MSNANEGLCCYPSCTCTPPCPKKTLTEHADLRTLEQKSRRQGETLVGDFCLRCDAFPAADCRAADCPFKAAKA